MFDTLRFLQDNFTDIDGVLRVLHDHVDVDPPQRAAVAKWFQRKSVPGDWFPVLLLAAEREHGRRDLGEYMQRPEYNDIFT